MALIWLTILILASPLCMGAAFAFGVFLVGSDPVADHRAAERACWEDKRTPAASE